MKFKMCILLLILIFSISSVSAIDLDGNDFIQTDDYELNNGNVINLQESDSSNPIDDSLAISDSDIQDSSNPIDDSLAISDSDIQDYDNDNIGDNLETENDILDDDGTDENDDIPNDIGDDEDENPLENVSVSDFRVSLINNSTKLTYGIDVNDIINNHNPLYGVVDFGSNTIHMEIYELKKSGNIKSVMSFSEVSVTAVYCVDNKLSPKGIDELISLLDDFTKIMDFVNVNTRYFFATASLRKIDNYEEVAAAVKEQLGIEIDIISGEHEATLSFNAVKDNDLITDDGLIIDLGGGSCEVIDFVNKTPVTMESMPFGSFSTYNEYVSDMFPNETETEAIRNMVLEKLSQLEVNNTVSRTDLYGVGGSVKTIKKVLRYLDYIGKKVDSVPVSMLDDLLNEFKDNTKENYYKILNVNPDRVNTFVPGLIITKTICEYFGIETLHFCKNGVREGVVQELVYLDSLKQDPNLNVSNIDVYQNEDIELSVNLDVNATGDVVVELNNMIFYNPVNNGKVLFNLPKLDCGDYTAKVSYGGDDNYSSANKKIKIHVKSVILNLSDMTRGFNSGLDYSVKLTDDEGNAIVDKLVLFAVGKINYYAKTNSNGVAAISPGLKIGTYKVTVSSPLLNGTATKTLKIVKRIQNNKNLNVYYNSNLKYRVKIIGDDGKAETKGKSVKVIIDNKQHTYKTDKDGFITIVLNKNFKPAKHTIKIQYKGFAVSNTVNVKHALSSKKTFDVKKSAKKIIIKAKLTLNNKKAIKGKSIRFKIKGKTYAAKTDSKGFAKITLAKSKFKKGNYQVNISYLKDIIKATVKVL